MSQSLREKPLLLLSFPQTVTVRDVAIGVPEVSQLKAPHPVDQPISNILRWAKGADATTIDRGPIASSRRLLHYVISLETEEEREGWPRLANFQSSHTASARETTACA